jgi:DNA invertase Pin-like site-specific DNA recombinase
LTSNELIDIIVLEVIILKTYFYIRVSSKDQNTIRQEVKAKEHNIPLENVYIEKASGKNISERSVLNNLMSTLKTGDKLIVDSISRFARNTRDLLDLVEQLNNKGVVFKSLKEDIDTATPTGVFMLTIFGAVAQLERDYIKERQLEGISIAVEQGKYKGRKPIEYPKQWDKYYTMMKQGTIRGVDVMKILDLKKTTFYKLIKQYEEDGN